MPSENVAISRYSHCSFRFCSDTSHRRHVKALESRSQLLDTALASADEANRRWEECRALVDQLRIENAALRAALSQAQMLAGSGAPAPTGTPTNSNVEEGGKNEGNKEGGQDGQ